MNILSIFGAFNVVCKAFALDDAALVWSKFLLLNICTGNLYVAARAWDALISSNSSISNSTLRISKRVQWILSSVNIGLAPISKLIPFDALYAEPVGSCVAGSINPLLRRLTNLTL